MDPQQQFCLKWNSFGSNLVSAFDNLFKSESLTDVTLFCEGVTFKAHRIILAACSKHFQDLFEAAPHCPSVLVILDGTSSTNMSALLEFMYKGEVQVKHESLSSFLKAAECLQVKGLSIEHEKMAEAQSDINFEPRIDSPSRSSKTTKSSTSDTPNSKESNEQQPASSGIHIPPSTSSYSTSVMSSQLYMHRYMMSQYDTTFEAPPRKRPHRSPSDSSVRASVLRDGSKIEQESPLSLTYSRSNTPPPHSEYHSRHPSSSPRPRYEVSGDSATNVTPSNSGAGGPTSAPFDRAAAVDSEPPADVWNSSSSCPEDLRVKLESPASERVKGSEWAGYSKESKSKPPTPDRTPANMWPINVNSGSTTKSLFKSTSGTVTADGKKLQCPFCERLYGYETNLRAHIRQRHQGIRVPCPFCSRTFTRNNTVRRHIAREHKSELSPFQQTDFKNDVSPFPQTDLPPFQQGDMIPLQQASNHNQ